MTTQSALAWRRPLAPAGPLVYPHRDPRGHDLTASPLAVLDFETTGLAAGTDRAVEIAVARLDEQGRVETEWTTLLNPGRPIGEASKIHGIDDAMVRHAPRFDQIVGDLLALLDGAIVVAHNASFDARFLVAELALTGVTLPPLAGLCTLTAARELLTLPGYKLEQCCRHYHLELRDAHSALGDVRATAALADALLHEHHEWFWDLASHPVLPQVTPSGLATPRP